MIFGDIISVLEFLSEIAVCFLLASRGSELRAQKSPMKVQRQVLKTLCRKVFRLNGRQKMTI